MRDGDALTFRELQSRCGNVSSSVLNQRLRELRDAAVITQQPGGYRLTADGEKLIIALAPVDAWANEWAGRLPACGSDG